MDYNNDGRPDLVIGDSLQYVYVALNTSDGPPVFGALQHVTSDGKWLQNPGSSKPTVWVVDWNNDGRKDLITGGETDYPDSGYAYLYLNTGTDANPTFGPWQTIDNNRNFGWRTSPVTGDWDGDGDKDLIVTSVFGDTKFYRNTGTDAAPTFGTGVHVTTESGNLVWGIETRLRAADWDGDGRPDLLIGDRYGEVRLYLRNHPPRLDLATNATVLLGQAVALDASGTVDPESDAMAFLWSFASKPTNSAASLLNPTVGTTSFTPDLPGVYEIVLTVSDGHGPPARARCTRQVVDPQSFRPLLSGIRRSSGQYELTLAGAPSLTCALEASSNLVHWVTVINLLATNGISSYLDEGAASRPLRFYRTRF